MLLDTPSLYFRAFFGVPDTVRSPDGHPVNAVRGLLDMIGTLVSRHHPDHLVAAMDADWRPQFRVDLVPSYKLHRVATDDGEEEVPDLLSPQVPVIEEVLRAFGIPVFGVPGYEADDVIGTLTARHVGPVDVVTGDRDLFQLIRDPDVRVLYTQKGIANLVIVDEAGITERYGIPGRAYADFALLRGDPSDGLPGVRGVGEKTAASLVSKYGDLAGILAATDIPATLRAKIDGARDYLAAAVPVVTVAHDAPVPDHTATLPRSPADPDALLALAERWGIVGAVTRLVDVLANRRG